MFLCKHQVGDDIIQCVRIHYFESKTSCHVCVHGLNRWIEVFDSFVWTCIKLWITKSQALKRNVFSSNSIHRDSPALVTQVSSNEKGAGMWCCHSVSSYWVTQWIFLMIASINVCMWVSSVPCTAATLPSYPGHQREMVII